MPNDTDQVNTDNDLHTHLDLPAQVIYLMSNTFHPYVVFDLCFVPLKLSVFPYILPLSLIDVPDSLERLNLGYNLVLT